MYYESFDYDKNGNKVYIDKNGEVTRYKYDGMNRLTRAWNDNTYTEYEFDNFNNISKEYELYGNSIETRSYYYDNANHLLLQDGKDTVQYEYDNAGNLVKKITGIGSNAETAYYSYDGYNRLSGYIDEDTVSEYAYNLDGLRESKTVNNIKTRYVYDGANIIGEITEENSYTYYRGTELIGYTSNRGDRLYYVQDGHGNVISLLNEDGTERKTYNYNPYGKEEEQILYPMGSKTAIMLWRLQVETPHNPFRYCGEYYDDETDLIYLRNRYYDNQTSRFITEDAHWNPSNMIYGDKEYKDEELKIPDINAIMQSDNLYVYCLNNPLKYSDPSGKEGVAFDMLYHALFGNGEYQDYSYNSKFLNTFISSVVINKKVNEKLSEFKKTGLKTSTITGNDLSLYGKSNLNDRDLALAVGKANYKMTFKKIEKTKKFLWRSWKETKYNVTVTITDRYDFDEYRDSKTLGSILNNWGYDRQKENKLKPFSWKITFTIKGLE